MLGGLAGFQGALVAGAPWGHVAWGGVHAGALPPWWRVASAGSAIVVSSLAVSLVRTLPRDPGRRRRVRTLAAGTCAVGAVLNAASPSLPERLLWAPYAAVLAGLLWRSRGVSGAAADPSG